MDNSPNSSQRQERTCPIILTHEQRPLCGFIKKYNQRRKTQKKGTQTEERGRTEGGGVEGEENRTGKKTGKTDEKGRTQTSENWEAENTKKRWTEEENP